MSYPCNLCQVAGAGGAGGADGGIGGAGTGGASTGGGRAGTGGAAGTDAGAPSRKSSGCAVVPEGPIGALATLLASLWFVGSALFAARSSPIRGGRPRPGAR
jgi:hypothetical protein